MIEATATIDPLQPPRIPLWKRLAAAAAWTAFFGLLWLGWWAMDLDWAELWTSRGNIATYLSGYFQGTPAEYLRYYDTYIKEMVITVHMAVWGTALAVLGAIPLGILAASNVAPVWVRQPVRRVLDALRAINEIVFALMFVAAVGLGPMAGMLALWVHTTGILGKLFSEAVEAIDPRPVEGIRATGSGVLCEVRYGVLPQVLPLWISYALYRFESNVRAGTVVGIVGAGGIGQLLHESIKSFNLTQAGSILLLIVLTVVIIDTISAQLRRLTI